MYSVYIKYRSYQHFTYFVKQSPILSLVDYKTVAWLNDPGAAIRVSAVLKGDISFWVWDISSTCNAVDQEKNILHSIFVTVKETPHPSWIS